MLIIVGLFLSFRQGIIIERGIRFLLSPDRFRGDLVIAIFFSGESEN